MKLKFSLSVIEAKQFSTTVNFFAARMNDKFDLQFKEITICGNLDSEHLVIYEIVDDL